MDKTEKWRLILGKESDPENQVQLEGDGLGMDDVLEALYNTERSGGLGSSSPNVNRWLGDIQRYFSKPIVEVMQQDAIERLGLHELLKEPKLLEQLEPNVHLVGTLLSLKSVIPTKTKATARILIRKVVAELQKRLQSPMQEAIKGAINKSLRHRRPKWQEIDWHRTIKANLKNYQIEHQAIIPELLIGYQRKGQALKHIILLVDQSGSMASSVVYASVFGAILASLRSIKTHFVAFDTAVVDLSEHLSDPVDILFGTQLGGGTDIAQALAYCNQLIEQANDTIIVLISDLYEGGNIRELYKNVDQIIRAGTQLISLLALSDDGKPAYDRTVAQEFANRSIPTFATTPAIFPEVMAAAIKGEDLQSLANYSR